MKMKKGMKDFKIITKLSIKHKRLIHKNLIKSLVKKQFDAFHYRKMSIIHQKIDNVPRVNVEELEYR